MLGAGALSGLLAIAGCTRDGQPQSYRMWNESRIKPYEGGITPGEPSSSRVIPAGAVSRSDFSKDDPIYTGRGADGKLLAVSPIPVTAEMLSRGQERYNIYCSPCHSRTGDGEGMAVRRSFPHPPDYAIPRLRKASLGHFYDVITNGYGVMYSYAQSVPVPDRWAIAAYLRVIQARRPVVPVDQWEGQRRRARTLGIPDPRRQNRMLHPEDAQGGTETRDPAHGTEGSAVTPGH